MFKVAMFHDVPDKKCVGCADYGGSNRVTVYTSPNSGNVQYVDIEEYTLYVSEHSPNR